jgi:hypothetical protein
MEAILVRCNACGHAMKVGADKAGRKAKCPKCEAVLTIPAADAPKPADPEPVTLAPAKPPDDDDDGDGSYGVTIDHDAAARLKRIEEEDRRRAKEAKKKKGPKVKRKFQALPDADEFEKVRLGLLFVFFGMLVWAFAHALHGLWVLMGYVEYHDYANMVMNQIRGQDPGAARFWNINQLNLLLGMVAGQGFLGFAKVCLIVETILYYVTALLWFVGYFICLPVPRRYGAFGELITCMVLGVFNFFVVLFLRLLPVLGAYQYYLVPFVVPEVSLVEYNIERVFPYEVLWSGSPFWEMFLTLFLEFFLALQPTIFAMFVWSVGRAIKDSRVEENASSVTQLGFGQFFILFSFHMMSVCGTTPVLINVVRVLYVLWWAFLLMFIVRSALLLTRARYYLDLKVNPDAHA